MLASVDSSTLSSKPFAIEAAAPQHVESVRRYFFDQVSKQRLETLAAVFDRVLDNLAERATAAGASR